MPDLTTPPTAVEIAELVSVLPAPHGLIVRRMAFQLDELTTLREQVRELAGSQDDLARANAQKLQFRQQRDALLRAAERLVSAYLLGDQKLIGEAVLETRDAVAQVENPTHPGENR